MKSFNKEYAHIISSDSISRMIGHRQVRYGRYTWPSYSTWIVPDSDLDGCALTSHQSKSPNSTDVGSARSGS
jgi:hypothetical protein